MFTRFKKNSAGALPFALATALIGAFWTGAATAETAPGEIITINNGKNIVALEFEEWSNQTKQLAGEIKTVYQRMAKYAPNSTFIAPNISQNIWNTDITACNTNPLQNGPFYCVIDEVVAFDTDYAIVFSLSRGATRGIMAHEMGHAATRHKIGETRFLDRINIDDANTRKIELMSDCIMGAYSVEFKDAQAGQEGVRASSRGDLDNPYFDDVTHGTPKQREAAYRAGIKLASVDKCIKDKRYN